MFRRRTFLIGCGSVVAAPAFAGAGIVPSAVAGSAMLPIPAVPLASSETEAFPLRVAGWDLPDIATADPNALWVQVNSSWQVAWR